MRDYTGKTVFIGIDVHKKTYAVTCICESVVVKRDTLPASSVILVKYLHTYFTGAKLKTVYEAGFSGFVLHRYLLSNGIENSVVHAASVEISARDRVKTDKRDSLKLATQLELKLINCGDVCIICLDTINTKCDIKCGHCICIECFYNWKYICNHNNCPCCKQLLC